MEEAAIVHLANLAVFYIAIPVSTHPSSLECLWKFCWSEAEPEQSDSQARRSQFIQAAETPLGL